MNNNKVVIFLTVLGVLLVIGFPTIYKVVKKHNSRLYDITEKRITQAAKSCWDEEKCQNDYVTLKELYDNNYLTKEADPVTKKYYSENSKIIKEEGNLVFKAE